MRVDLRPELEALLAAEACAKGLSVEQIAEQLPLTEKLL
jgi:hypothetical protein